MKKYNPKFLLIGFAICFSSFFIGMFFLIVLNQVPLGILTIFGLFFFGFLFLSLGDKFYNRILESKIRKIGVRELCLVQNVSFGNASVNNSTVRVFELVTPNGEIIKLKYLFSPLNQVPAVGSKVFVVYDKSNPQRAFIDSDQMTDRPESEPINYTSMGIDLLNQWKRHKTGESIDSESTQPNRGGNILEQWSQNMSEPNNTTENQNVQTNVQDTLNQVQQQQEQSINIQQTVYQQQPSQSFNVQQSAYQPQQEQEVLQPVLPLESQPNIQPEQVQQPQPNVQSFTYKVFPYTTVINELLNKNELIKNGNGETLKCDLTSFKQLISKDGVGVYQCKFKVDDRTGRFVTVAIYETSEVPEKDMRYTIKLSETDKKECSIIN